MILHKRSLAKTGTWYGVHFLMVLSIGTVITKDFSLGATIASAELIFESVLFYVHEHLWSKVK